MIPEISLYNYQLDSIKDDTVLLDPNPEEVIITLLSITQHQGHILANKKLPLLPNWRSFVCHFINFMLVSGAC